MEQRDDDKVYNRLKVLRVDQGLSRQALATALNVHYQTVGYLERGTYNPSLALALRLAEHLGVSVESVFSRSPFPPLSSHIARPRPERPASPPEESR